MKEPLNSSCVYMLAGAWIFLFSAGMAFSQEEAGFGDPLPDLTSEQLALFEAGKEDFEEVEEVEEGLGPIFNARGCAECHSMPVVGGSSTTNEVRAGRFLQKGSFKELPGGSLFQIFSINPDSCQEIIPPEANLIAFRQVQPLFGLGLIEAISEETILAREDPADRDRDGISGRAAKVLDQASSQMRLGRFGWKAQQASLLGFSGDAYLNEMGITNDLAPEENAPNGDLERLSACDQLPDPEDERDPATGRRGIDNFENFMRFLGPPPRGFISPSARHGEAVFHAIGCAKCHTPAMEIGPNDVAALSRKTVPLFSDLLLHDLGTGDGIPQADAGPNEFRTPPLWGLRMSRPFLHDGSAATVEEAIRRHGGEAKHITRRFLGLPNTGKLKLLAFLESL